VRCHTGVLVALALSVAACGSAQGTRAPGGTPQPAGGLARASGPASASRQPCGAAAPEVLARTIGTVATRIYGNELASGEVHSDERQVERFAPLLAAVSSGNREATLAAVTSLVFSHTHIVRLRVTRDGAVLADVGGPLILAPVSGHLRRSGRTIGAYVLSVQDDSGYVKLVTRFIGVAIVLRAGSHTLSVEGALFPAPANIPAHGPLGFQGGRYQSFTFTARAFPSGSLSIALLVPISHLLAGRTCAEVRDAELGNVARRVSRRFSLAPSNLDAYINATTPLTSGLIYIRTLAPHPRQLAGSTQRGPRALPARGRVSYRGKSYSVFSFTVPSAVGALRVYQLIRE
jgi:hypothetical protein